MLLGWVVALVAVTAIHSAAGSAYSDNFRLSGTQSFDAVNLLERNAPKASGDTEQVVIAVDQGRVTDPAVRARWSRGLRKLARQPHVSEIASPYGPRGAAQISPSGQIAFANVTFDVQANKSPLPRPRAFVNAARAGAGGGVEIEVEGQVAEAAKSKVRAASRSASSPRQSSCSSCSARCWRCCCRSDRRPVARHRRRASIGLLSHVIQMASFLDELALLIGLGVGVDYALFIVTRYRQGLLRGLSREEAVVESLDTSGRAVLFAGVIVCIAMLGMFAARGQLPVRRRGRAPRSRSRSRSSPR